MSELGHPITLTLPHTLGHMITYRTGACRRVPTLNDLDEMILFIMILK